MKERFLIWLAYHLPKSLVYWCSIRLICNATAGEFKNQIVPELKALDALKRWEA